MTSITAIKKFFEEGSNGRKVQMTELKALSAADRDELGKAACVELGEQWEESTLRKS